MLKFYPPVKGIDAFYPRGKANFSMSVVERRESWETSAVISHYFAISLANSWQHRAHPASTERRNWKLNDDLTFLQQGLFRQWFLGCGWWFSESCVAQLWAGRILRYTVPNYDAKALRLWLCLLGLCLLDRSDPHHSLKSLAKAVVKKLGKIASAQRSLSTSQ